MSSTRLWIVLLAATCFLAGLAGGILTGIRIAPRTVEPRAFADYADLLIETYDVPPERERYLWAFLQQYHRDLEELKARNVAQAEPEVIRLGEICRQRIRDYILSEEDRVAFDREARALTSPDSLSLAAYPDRDN